MASLLVSLPAATAAILLLISLSLSLPSLAYSDDNLQLHSRRNLISISDKGDLDSPVSKNIPPNKKIASESLNAKNSTKSMKSKKPSSAISPSSPIISTSVAKPKLNKTVSANNKSKLNKTLTAIPAAFMAGLNKTGIVAKTNATKLPKLLKALKANSTKSISLKLNSTKIHQLQSPNSSPKTQKKFQAKDPPPGKLQSTPKPLTKSSQTTMEVDKDVAGDNDDLISEFRDLPSRIHSALLPDLHKLSTTSRLYLSKTHREIVAGMKPFVGKKYAPSIASAALLILPFLLVTVLFRHLLRAGNSASMHRAVIFVQAYLAIYFATLALTAVATGLEPLRFFYATSPGAYAWTQAAQTFGYVVYLIAQLIALVAAFSVGEGEGGAGKAVCLAQMLLGLAVGMHYYITVLHRAVAGDEPRANWKVHGIYATCFVVICGLGRADRRKKADGKKS